MADVDRPRLADVLLGTGGVFVLVTVSVGLGRAVTLGADGAVVSWMDLAAAAVAALGAWHLVRGRPSTGGTDQRGKGRVDWAAWLPQDPAVAVLWLLVTYLGFQVVVPFVGEAMDVEIASGASRFVFPALLLTGLTWLARSPGVRHRDGTPARSWPWREALVALGLLIMVGIVRDVIAAVGQDVGGFYDWKRAIQQELGVSNILAAYTAMAMWCGASLALEDRRWLPAPILLAIATAVSLSRAAILAVVVAAALVAIGARLGGRLAAALLVVVTIGLTVVPIAMDTQAGADGLVSSALRVRDEQFTAAWEAWQDQPLFGVGLNRFEEDVQVVTSQPTAAAVDGVIPYEHPNNAWLVALAELGLVGTLLYLALWVLLLQRILRLPDGWEKAGAAAAVAGLAVHAQLEALTFTRGIEMVLALLLGALGATSRPGGMVADGRQ